MFSLIYAWINDWVNNREAGDLRRQRGHYDVIVMFCFSTVKLQTINIIFISTWTKYTQKSIDCEAYKKDSNTVLACLLVIDNLGLIWWQVIYEW